MPQTKQNKTKFSLPRLDKALKNERRADLDRSSAETAWRQSWWETTRLLAACPGEDWSEAKATYLANIGSIKMASDRRKAGRRLPESFFTEGQLPGPRMALSAATALGADASDEATAEMVAKLYAAEADGLTLREFSQAITGRSWTNVPEELTRADEDAIIRRLADRRPEALAAAVADSPKAMGAVDDERSRRRTTPSPSSSPNPVDEVDSIDTRWMDTSSLLGELSGLTARLRRDVDGNMEVWRAEPSFALRLRESANRLAGYADAIDGISDADLAQLFAEEAS